MTSNLLAPARTEAATSRPRPLALVATGGGMVAALLPLVVCLCVGVVGWFLSDSGLHGTTRDGLRAGGLAWLMAHGSGVTVQGALVSIVPLGLTLVVAWTTWRVAHRVGDMVSGHGPDADRISDGERDWTVPVAIALFLVGYAVVAVVTSSLATGDGAAPSLARVLGWTLLLTVAVAAPAIAVGSGRAAIWAQFLPALLRDAAATVPWVLGSLFAASGLVLLGALVLGLGDAASMMSRLHLQPGEAVLYTLVNAGFLPNAWTMATSWLLGPGFAVGVGTLVSPALVVLGPLPLLPLLAALPGTGDPSTLVASVVALPPLLAALAVAGAQRRRPTVRWDEGALRGCGAGIVSGLVVGVLAVLSGGAAGPGRMSQVGAPAGEVLVHAITALGLGGLLGGLLMTWWQRRTARTTAPTAGGTDSPRS